ncbi:MAG: MurR/RpiR family transcriptional regulator [Firmicutes bacterium]|nr:MurR/RpiR family transcriptional regulator [Bacillota bacterium]
MSVQPDQAGACLARIRQMYSSLYQAEQKVASFVLSHPEDIIHLSITEVAERSGVSEATVVRFCQSLGYKGYHELKITLAGEIVSPLRLVHEDIREDDDVAQVIEKVFHSDMQALHDTKKILDAAEIEKAVQAIAVARKVEFYAAGNSIPVALDAHYRFLRIGVPSSLYFDPAIQAMSATLLTKYDVAIGISHSGSSKDTVESLGLAREAGATTICITNHSKSPITQVAAIQLFTTSDETTFRDEAMASRIAEFAIIDTLYVGVALRRFSQSLAYIRKTGEVVVDRKF